MSVKIINGFKIYDETTYKTLIIDSYRISECMDFFKKENFAGISISRYYGYKLNELDFLKDYPFIEQISVTSQTIKLSGLNYLTNLKSLSLINGKQKIDFSNFPNLKNCKIEWNNKLKNINSCKKLSKLQITKFNTKDKNLIILSDLINLEKLNLIRTNINSLKGIEKLLKLEELEINFAKNIEYLSEIVNISDTLKILYLNNCKNIKDYKDIAKLQNLYWLKLTKCNNIASLKFIKQMPNLKKLSFVDTNILDGNLKACIGLDFIGFSNKKHYSHTLQQIRKLNNPQKKNKFLKIGIENLKKVSIY